MIKLGKFEMTNGALQLGRTHGELLHGSWKEILRYGGKSSEGIAMKNYLHDSWTGLKSSDLEHWVHAGWFASRLEIVAEISEIYVYAVRYSAGSFYICCCSVNIGLALRPFFFLQERESVSVFYGVLLS